MNYKMQVLDVMQQYFPDQLPDVASKSDAALLLLYADMLEMGYIGTAKPQQLKEAS